MRLLSRRSKPSPTPPPPSWWPSTSKRWKEFLKAMSEAPMSDTPDVIFPGDPAAFTGSFPVPSQAQTVSFTSNGTWTKPSGAQSVTVTLIGQGAGGGSGRRGASGTVRNGGGGGSGAGWAWMTYPASALPATVTVSVNDPGTGGGGSTGTTITDSFNRANSTTTLGSTDTGQAWTYPNGSSSSGYWGISSNQAYNVGGAAVNAALQNAGSADVSASVVLAIPGGNDASILIRSNSDASAYIFYNGALGQVQRYGYGTSPTFTYASGKSSADFAAVAGDTIALSASGSTVTVSKNGTTICTFTDTATNTYTGIRASSPTPRFDNFSASSASGGMAAGALGSGGPAVTVDSTNGTDGLPGSSTKFGPYLSAQGGQGGAAGTAAPAGTVGSPAATGTIAIAANGGGTAASGGAGANGLAAAGVCGAGGGGGLTTGNAASDGGAGNFPTLLSPSGSFQSSAGGTASGSSNGQDGATLTAGVPLPGIGGGGGRSNVGAAGGNGGNGGSYGAPGGGGAASANGYASGKGGNGGPGIAVITTYF